MRLKTNVYYNCHGLNKLEFHIINKSSLLFYFYLHNVIVLSISLSRTLLYLNIAKWAKVAKDLLLSLSLFSPRWGLSSFIKFRMDEDRSPCQLLSYVIKRMMKWWMLCREYLVSFLPAFISMSYTFFSSDMKMIELSGWSLVLSIWNQQVMKLNCWRFLRNLRQTTKFVTFKGKHLLNCLLTNLRFPVQQSPLMQTIVLLSKYKKMVLFAKVASRSTVDHLA